ncbi:MAG: hypothetical protein APF81_08540 [Desulfosporosinus sp. BRH_c37]|nr:MAG: hypothetical protein APF81_08540 [Desulfosporosinus sp. BRH_c37]
MEIKLLKPTTYDDVEYKKLVLDLEELSGQDLINATKEAKALGDKSAVAEFSKTYQAVVAAKAAKVPVDLILLLKAKDFTQVTLHTQNFLLDGGSAETSTTPSVTLQ